MHGLLVLNLLYVYSYLIQLAIYRRLGFHTKATNFPWNKETQILYLSGLIPDKFRLHNNRERTNFTAGEHRRPEKQESFLSRMIRQMEQWKMIRYSAHYLDRCDGKRLDSWNMRALIDVPNSRVLLQSFENWLEWI